MKRFVCVLLAVFLMLSLLPTAAFAAAQAYKVGKVTVTGNSFAENGGGL